MKFIPWKRRRLQESVNVREFNVKDFFDANPNWHKIDDYFEEDIFLAAYPKSGVTWLQNIIAGLVYGVDPAKAPDRLVQELIPDVHYKKVYKRFSTPAVFKTHDFPRSDYRRVIHLVRDGRDAMVSYYHFLNASVKVSWEEMLVDDKLLFPGSWAQHTRAWLTNPHHADIFRIRYEDLLEDLETNLKSLAEYFNLDSDETEIKRIAQRSRFNYLASKEEEQGLDNPLWPKNKKFFRRGISGSYRDEMPPDICSRFESQSETELSELGYL